MSHNTAQPPPPGTGSDMGTGHGAGHGRHHHDHDYDHDRAAAWAAGGTLFAGTLLLVSGIMDILQGIVAIARDSVYARVHNYVYSFNITSWGWIHLALGVLMVVIGLGVLRGATWARMTGIVLASLNVFAQFMFLPFAPVWSILALGVSVFVIWSLAWGHGGHRTV
ncbi:DUF7144 family membrane protein [Streptomyces sp. 8L]|uniref:DUF7144 family membrane protein n=1 Tax=Streptomyces sp. 8L TaxID=2877242 RepID=UPI001CD74A60|nr:hypothetical protein [Streptomyces sp. 8L]MCA1221241.1 hypothetical protein [Streptomyces sp. 8L]